jgi:hypothetical protein
MIKKHGGSMITPSLVKNAADPDQVQQAKEISESLNDRRINDIREVLSTKRGRRFFWRYLEICGIFKTSNADSSQIFFNEGMRNVGLMLLADVNEAAPDAYLLMLRESQEE